MLKSFNKILTPNNFGCMLKSFNIYFFSQEKLYNLSFLYATLDPNQIIWTFMLIKTDFGNDFGPFEFHHQYHKLLVTGQDEILDTSSSADSLDG